MGFDKRESAKSYQPQEGDTLEAIADRENAAGNPLTWQELARFNWGTEDPKQVDEFLRDELGTRKRDASNRFVVALDDDRRSELRIPKAFAKTGFPLEREHVLRVQAKSAPAQFEVCSCIPGVTFEFDKSFLRPSVVDNLKELETQLAAHPDSKIMIFGHTDKVGTDDYNKKLSERRAKSVFAFITNDADTWEALFNEEHWGTRVVQEILKDLGFDPGPIDGVDGPQTQTAVRSYQGSRGLTADGVAGPVTRKRLFADYMGSKHDIHATADQFMDPKHMGCGEFNPVLATEAEHEPNRRVVVFLFNKDRLPKLPCKQGDLAPCRKQIDPPAPRFKASFRCSLFDSLARDCACAKGDGPVPPVLVPTVKLLKIETSDPIKPPLAVVFQSDDDFTPVLGEQAKISVQVDGLAPSFNGKLRVDVGRLTNKADDPATADVNESFSLVARLEVAVGPGPASRVIEVAWDGKATVAVPAKFSNRKTRDNVAGADVEIPLTAIASGAEVLPGLYHVDQITLLEGATERAKQRPKDVDLSVPQVANLLFNASWPTDLAAFGLAPFRADIERALLRYGERDYQARDADPKNRINVRFVTQTGLSNAKSLVVSIGGNKANGLFGSTPDGPSPLSDNLYAAQRSIGGNVEVFPGTFMIFNTAGGQIGPTDQAEFQKIFAPLGVGAAANAGAPGVASARSVTGGSVTGACTAAEDAANVTVTLDVDGIANVTTKDPAVAPASRASDIQRALRAFVRMVGNTTNHELAHSLGVVSRVLANNAITIDGVTRTSPLDGDGGAHNKVNANTNIVDGGGSRSFVRRIESTGVVQKFNATNMRYLRDCVPHDRKDQ